MIGPFGQRFTPFPVCPQKWPNPSINLPNAYLWNARRVSRRPFDAAFVLGHRSAVSLVLARVLQPLVGQFTLLDGKEIGVLRAQDEPLHRKVKIATLF